MSNVEETRKRGREASEQVEDRWWECTQVDGGHAHTGKMEENRRRHCQPPKGAII